MNRLIINSLTILAVITLGVNQFVWFSYILLDWLGMMALVNGTLAIWAITAILACSIIKSPAWLRCPVGFVSATVTLVAGVVGTYQGSVALFLLLFALTLTASVIAVRESRSGTPGHRTFCRAYAICLWLGLACVLTARGAITGTPIVIIMWWSATVWGNVFDSNGASLNGIYYLLLSWVFAFAGARLCILGWSRWGDGTNKARPA
jgi:hypothetical protein